MVLSTLSHTESHCELMVLSTLSHTESHCELMVLSKLSHTESHCELMVLSTLSHTESHCVQFYSFSAVQSRFGDRCFAATEFRIPKTTENIHVSNGLRHIVTF